MDKQGKDLKWSSKDKALVIAMRNIEVQKRQKSFMLQGFILDAYAFSLPIFAPATNLKPNSFQYISRYQAKNIQEEVTYFRVQGVQDLLKNEVEKYLILPQRVM